MSTGDASDYNFFVVRDHRRTRNIPSFIPDLYGFILPNKGNRLHTKTIPYLTSLRRL